MMVRSLSKLDGIGIRTATQNQYGLMSDSVCCCFFWLLLLVSQHSCTVCSVLPWWLMSPPISGAALTPQVRALALLPLWKHRTRSSCIWPSDTSVISTSSSVFFTLLLSIYGNTKVLQMNWINHPKKKIRNHYFSILELSATLIGTPILLHMHAITQSAKYMITGQELQLICTSHIKMRISASWFDYSMINSFKAFLIIHNV